MDSSRFICRPENRSGFLVRRKKKLIIHDDLIIEQNLCEDTFDDMGFRFEELKVFQIAVVLSNKIDSVAEKFPRKEMFNLSSQIRRAADSVILNIAEGSTGQSKPEFRRFLGIALRSAIEVAACLHIAFTRKYIMESEYKMLYHEYEILCKMITKLRDSL